MCKNVKIIAVALFGQVVLFVAIWDAQAQVVKVSYRAMASLDQYLMQDDPAGWTKAAEF